MFLAIIIFALKVFNLLLKIKALVIRLIICLIYCNWLNLVLSYYVELGGDAQHK